MPAPWPLAKITFFTPLRNAALANASPIVRSQDRIVNQFNKTLSEAISQKLALKRKGQQLDTSTRLFCHIAREKRAT